MRRFLHDNGLSVALFSLFLVSLIGQALTGWRAHAEDLRIHDMPALGLLSYLGSGHFISAVFENWESEFLQMATYVVLTIFLFQKGASESKKPDEATLRMNRRPLTATIRRHRGLSTVAACC